MKKKKYLLVSLITIVCILIFTVVLTLSINKNNEETPINYLIESINNKNTVEIPKAFHEYCSLCIEQNISEKDFNEYIDNIIEDFGNDYKVSYKIVNTEKLSNNEVESHETNALYTYSNYPYFSNGGEVKFECINKITVNITISGNKQEQNSNVDFLIVKIDGKFYFLHTPNQLMSMFIRY